METKERVTNNTEKKQWVQPELTHYGSVEKITLKGWGAQDGQGLEPAGHHPSL